MQANNVMTKVVVKLTESVYQMRRYLNLHDSRLYITNITQSFFSLTRLLKYLLYVCGSRAPSAVRFHSDSSLPLFTVACGRCS